MKRTTAKRVLRLLFILFVVCPAGVMLGLYAGIMIADTRSYLPRSSALLYSLQNGLEAYYRDHQTYPSMVPMTSHGGAAPESVKAWAPMAIGPEITTPIAYLSLLPPEQYSKSVKGEGLPPAYYTDGKGFILISPGPDRDYDIDPPRDYDSSTTRPTTALILKKYDPSNGAGSDGVLFEIKGGNRYRQVLDGDISRVKH